MQSSFPELLTLRESQASLLVLAFEAQLPVLPAFVHQS